MKIVASITTIPSRINFIKPTLDSILNQSIPINDIYLNIPYSSKKENINYIIPLDIDKNAHVVRCQDYGPITKLFGALVSESDPDTIIITFDDDTVYPESLVEKLLAKHKRKNNVAIGSSGIKIGGFPFYFSITNNEYSKNSHWYNFDGNGEKVDILLGSSAVMYKRGFFPDRENIADILKYQEDPILSKNDSVVISAFLAKQNIDRWVYKMPRVERSESKKDIGHYLDFIRAWWRMREYFDNVDYVKKSTITFPFIVGFILISTLIAMTFIRQ